MINKINIFLIIGILFLTLGCGQSKTEELKRGRIKYIETLNYGSVGTHGSQGWYVSDRNFYINETRWRPEGIKVKQDISSCEVSPNTSVEVLKCYSFNDGKERVYILRIKDGKAEWLIASDMNYDRGDNLGSWSDDGHWLLFRDYFFNVETSEKRMVKGLPDDPEKHFRAVSPDLETIVYAETCFVLRHDLPDGKSKEEEIHKQCTLSNEHIEKGIAAFWLIDAKTGNVKILELKKDKYDWLIWKQERFPTYWEWLAFFQKQLVWEKDKDGKDQLVAPK